MADNAAMSGSKLVSVAAAVACGACVMPPLRVGVGGGMAAGHIATVDRQGTTYDHGTAFLGDLRFGLTPVTVASGPLRSFDLSLGCDLSYVDARDGSQRHDGSFLPYAEVGWFPHVVSVGDKSWRVGPTALVEIPYALHDPTDRNQSSGWGLGGGVLAELVEGVHGRMLAGRVSGAWGLGVAARGGVRHVLGETYGYMLLTVEVRVPAMVAIPIPTPDRVRGVND